MSQALPEFDAPPVAEMSLAVHFEALTELRGAHLGMFADQLATSEPSFRWSDLEEELPRAVVVEQFSQSFFRPPFKLQIAEEAPPPRTVLRDARAHRAVAMQQDSFEYSWWKDAADGTYPRYSSLVEEFLAFLAAFERFVVSRKIGSLRFRQVQVAYQNSLQRGVDWPEDGTAAEVLRSWVEVQGQGLPPVEDAHLAQTHLLTDSEGTRYARLYITLDTHVRPPFRRGAETDWAALTLTFRGALQGKGGVDEVKSLSARGREAIVQSFADVTTEDAHARWRRTR